MSLSLLYSRRTLAVVVALVLTVALFVALSAQTAGANPALTGSLSVAGHNAYSISVLDLESILGTTAPEGPIAREDLSPDQQAAVTALAAKIATAYYRAPIARAYAYNGKTKLMYIKAGIDGFTIQAASVEDALYDGLAAYDGDGSIEATASGATTTAALGKGIVVDQSLRYLYLYNGGRIVAKYRCTVGMSSYRTPNGYFVMGTKRKNPSWGNPGSAWAKSMPKYIAPGPSNPLGVRAMNINTTAGRDTGFRIHGTTRTYEIGRAASHGCVRLTNANVTKLYDLVAKGTPIIIQP